MAPMTCCTLRPTTPPSLAGPGRVSVVIIQARKSPCCCPSRSLSLSRLYTASQSQAGRRHKAHQKPTQPHIITPHTQPSTRGPLKLNGNLQREGAKLQLLSVLQIKRSLPDLPDVKSDRLFNECARTHRIPPPLSFLLSHKRKHTNG